MTAHDITVQDLRESLHAGCGGPCGIRPTAAHLAAFDALAAKAARTDALEAENAALLAERAELSGIIGSLDSTNAALVKERDALIGIAAKYIQTHELHDFTNEVRAQVHDKAVQEPIYQTGWPNQTAVWGDVPKDAYDTYTDHGYTRRRIVYAAPQQAAQEPVAWRYPYRGKFGYYGPGDTVQVEIAQQSEPLYAAPQQASEQSAAVEQRIRALWQADKPGELGPSDSQESQYRFGYNTALEDVLDLLWVSK